MVICKDFGMPTTCGYSIYFKDLLEMWRALRVLTRVGAGAQYGLRGRPLEIMDWFGLRDASGSKAISTILSGLKMKLGSSFTFASSEVEEL